MNRETTVYRFYGYDSALLYVGISHAVFTRWQQHKSDKHWWSEICSASLQHFTTRQAALATELEAIRSERPRYNLAGKVPAVQPPIDHDWLAFLRGLEQDADDRRELADPLFSPGERCVCGHREDDHENGVCLVDSDGYRASLPCPCECYTFSWTEAA